MRLLTPQDSEEQEMAEPQKKLLPPIKASGDGIVFQIGVGELVKMVGAILLVGGAFWALKSDLRDIRTNQDWQAKVQDDRWRTSEERMSSLDKKWQLQQYDLQQINLALARAGLLPPGSTLTITNQPVQPGQNGGPK